MFFTEGDDNEVRDLMTAVHNSFVILLGNIISIDVGGAGRPLFGRGEPDNSGAH